MDDTAVSRPWAYDVATEHAPLSTTGGRLWDAARRLCEYLEAQAGPLGLGRPGLTVLELGAGLGWLGMTLARNTPGAGMVVLTEQEEGGGLDWLRHNLDLNAHLPGMAAVRAEPCDWRLYGGGAAPSAAEAAAASAPDRPLTLPSDQAGEGRRDDCRVEQAGEAGDALRSGAGGMDGEALTRGCGGMGASGTANGLGGCAGGPLQGASCSGSCGDAAGVGAAAGSRANTSSGDSTGDGGDACRGGAGGGPSCPGPCTQPQPPSQAGGAWLGRQVWDLILGSDLVYNEVGAVYLPRVLRALAGPDTTILYCHTRHRFDTFDMQFFEQLTACGLVWREVREPGLPSPPPSPPPLTELFPEMRIAVYDIRLQPGAPPPPPLPPLLP